MKETDKDLLPYIYTDFAFLKEELRARSENKELRAKFDKFFGDFLPQELVQGPKAIMSRSIATPNTEFRYFMDLVSELGMDPLIFEYPDKFVGKNKDKHHLCKLYFYEGLGKHNGVNISTERIVNFNTQEGKMLSDIDTLWGEKLTDFHHRILFEKFPDFKGKAVDFSPWFDVAKRKSEFYYFYYLALFVCGGVLFENFLIGDKEEVGFIRDKFLPSFKKVEEIFGVKPLIYPLLPFENEMKTHWLCYSDEVKALLGDHMLKND